MKKRYSEEQIIGVLHEADAGLPVTLPALRKFYNLWVSQKSPLVEEALAFYRTLYEIERRAQTLNADARRSPAPSTPA